MINVLLVDDHELVSNGIAALLAAETDIAVVGVCRSGEEALAHICKQPPDIVLMDVQMPGIGGVETCRRIVESKANTKIIILSVCNDGPLPQQLIKMGVQGFIYKGSPVPEMTDAIRRVFAGQRYLCAEIANKLALRSMLGDEESPFDKLSNREAEVACLILQGKTIAQMAEILQISDKTINTFRRRLYKKLDVKNDVELTHLALKYHFIVAPPQN